MYNEPDPDFPQECVRDYVKGDIILDASSYEVLHTCSPSKEISGTGSPLLDQLALRMPGKKKSFADIVRG